MRLRSPFLIAFAASLLLMLIGFEVAQTIRNDKHDLAALLHPGDEDPSAVTRTEKPYSFGKRDGIYEIRVLLPFATKGEVGLFKKGDELVVEIGTLRRHIGLPRSMAMLLPSRAKLENGLLTVEMQEAK